MEGCGADYFIVVELAIFVAPPLDVEFSTEGGVVSLGDLVTVWMEDASEVFRSLDLPFGFRVWVFTHTPRSGHFCLPLWVGVSLSSSYPLRFLVDIDAGRFALNDLFWTMS